MTSFENVKAFKRNFFLKKDLICELSPLNSSPCETSMAPLEHETLTIAKLNEVPVLLCESHC